MFAVPAALDIRKAPLGASGDGLVRVPSKYEVDGGGPSKRGCNIPGGAVAKEDGGVAAAL